MRYSRLQLQRLSCTASKDCLHPTVYTRLLCPAKPHSLQTRHLSYNDNNRPQIRGTSYSRNLPLHVQSVLRNSTKKSCDRSYASAQAVQDLSADTRHDEAEEEPEEQYTEDATEFQLTEAESKRIAPPIVCVNLLNIRGLVRKILQRLHDDNDVVSFDNFRMWDDVVPILAKRLGLRYTIIKESSPYYDLASRLQSGTPYRINRSDRGKFHILTKSHKHLPEFEEVDKSLFAALHDHVYNQNVEHWLQNFSDNLDIPSYPAWKVLVLVCRNSPPAMPRVEVIQEDWKTQSYKLRFSNKTYNISVVKSLGASATISNTLFNAALFEYLGQIHKALLPNDKNRFCFNPNIRGWDPATFLGRGLRALGWGDVKFEETQPEDFVPSTYSSSLYEIRTATPKYGSPGLASEGAIWRDRKLTRLLAIYHACAALQHHLRAAYELGTLTAGEYQAFAQYWNEYPPKVQQRDVEYEQVHLMDAITSDASKVATHKITINKNVVTDMVESLRALVLAGFKSTYQWESSESAGLGVNHARPRAIAKFRNLDHTQYRSYLWRVAHLANDHSALPVREENICSRIKESINNSDVTVIIAATGSGKTTQVPQIILDDFIAARNGSMCSIVCTQPRRVSAISVAERVAFERRQPLGIEVGYKIRFDSHPTKFGRGITYMTSGYLSRLLERDPLNILDRHSHIILDEVHARDVDTDLILANLKNFLGKRTMVNPLKMPKIILMSASINAEFFQSYFKELGSNVKVTAIDVPGKMFDVEYKTLDHLLTELQESYPSQLARLLEVPDVGRYVEEQLDSDPKDEKTTNDEEVVEDTKVADAKPANQDLFVPVPLLHLMIVRLLSSTSSGDILVFLPGLGEIDALEELLQQDPLSQTDISNPEQYRIFKLHSALYQTNYDVFSEVPKGCRRIVLATNIAETSITLPSVKFVIDTGLSRQTTFDQVTQSGTFGLQWISKAEVMQRKGRAGRTQAGVYYGLYSPARYNAMSDAPTPEILRISLDHLVLRCSSDPSSQVLPQHWPKVPGIEEVRAGHTLLTTPTPPEVSYVAAAGQQLHYIHALTAEGRPTPMGLALSNLPVSPTAGKAVLLGIVFRCLDVALIFGALREDSPLMYDSAGIGRIAERRRKLANGTDDDKWADSQAFFSYDRARRENEDFAAEKVKADLSIRHDAYCEYAQIAEQTFETIQPMMGLLEHSEQKSEGSSPWPLFPSTPQIFNNNSTNADLIKALAFSTSGTRFACWNRKNWGTQVHPRVLPHPKSVNHNGSRRTILAQRLRRENGDLLSYAAMRIIPKDKYPWLHDTSAVTPLMAILFAESVSLLEKEAAFVINGWVRYELSPAVPNKETRFAAKIIWEYRKALDRFLAHVMQTISIEPEKILKVKTGELELDELNIFFRREDSPIRKIIVDSVIKVLETDAKDRRDRTITRALEKHGIEPAVAEDFQRRGDLEGLIEYILNSSKNLSKSPTSSQPEKSSGPSSSVTENLSAEESTTLDEQTSEDHAERLAN